MISVMADMDASAFCAFVFCIKDTNLPITKWDFVRMAEFRLGSWNLTGILAVLVCIILVAAFTLLGILFRKLTVLSVKRLSEGHLKLRGLA